MSRITTANPRDRETELRLSGERIMRQQYNNDHHMTERQRVNKVKAGMMKRVIKGLSALSLGLLMVATASAAPLSGKVFLDYDNNQATNAPLGGLTVELQNSSGAVLSTSTTSSDGSYSFNTPTLGSFKVNAITANNEAQSLDISVSGSSGITSQNIFLKGQGGDIKLRILDTASVGLKGIPVTVSAMGYADISMVTNSAGYIEINNSLMGVTYKAKVLPSDIIEDEVNTTKYALWDATLANGSQAYVSEIDFAMIGANQSGVFNVRQRNAWGADGFVAVDQDSNSIYGPNTDTPVSGMTVDLYYQGTTTKVLGIASITTGNNGQYKFQNLPLGSYTVKLTNVSSPWQMVTADQADFTVAVTTGNPSAFNFLLDVDPNDTTMASVYGYVFAVGNDEYMRRGPDSGEVLAHAPTAASTVLSLPLELYQHNGTSWVKISSVTSNTTSGSYAFKGLAKNQDYKIKIANDTSITNNYVFSNDFDGKSPTRTVLLSTGTSEPIAAKEIVLVNLNTTKRQHNFIYSNKVNVQVYAHVSAYNIFNYDTNSAWAPWGNTFYGLGSASLSPSIKVKLYEEDGITPVNNTSGLPAEWWVLSSDKNRYGGINQAKTDVDHKSIYVIKLIDYDTVGYPVGASSVPSYIYAHTQKTYTQNAFVITGSNKVEGTFFLNKSNTGSFVSGTDIPLLGIGVQLYRLRTGSTSTWDYISNTVTNASGKYGFVSLPNGQYRVQAHTLGPLSLGSDTIQLEGDVDNITAIGAIEVDLSAGNVAIAGQDVLYKMKHNDYVFKGKVFLDTYYGDGKITAVNANYLYDLSLPKATVLLCLDSGNEANCEIGGTDYIDHQITHLDGKYEFNTTSTPSLLAGTNYIIKAYRDDVVMLNNSSVKSVYQVSTPASGYELPVVNNFLAKGNTTQPSRYHGWVGNDKDGNQVMTEYSETITWRGVLQYWDHSANDWVTWDTIGNFYGQFDLHNLPAGKYRHYYKDQIGNDAWVADSSPAVPVLGDIRFEILPSGAMADGFANTNRHVYLANVLASGVTKAISGGIYLDITGSGIKDDSSVLLPASFLSGTSVKGFFTPRVYSNYSLDPMAVINSGTPDFEDTDVATNNGEFAYTVANKQLHTDFRYTNYLLSLEGLSPNFSIVANSGYQKNYLPAAILGDKHYMQVDGLESGVANQFWLVRLNVPTEISGRLYYDLDNSGDFNTGDTPMTDVRVELWKDGAFYSYITTDNDGVYRFTGILDGNYEVRATSIGLGSLYQIENPSTGIISSLSLSVSSSAVLDNNDFTYKKIGDASISGNVMVDINNNGNVDINFSKTGDMALSGVTIELHKGAIGPTPYKTTQTNAKGYYSFGGIDLNASYLINLVTPSGYGVIKNTDGGTTNTLLPITIGATPVSASNQYFLLAGGSNSNPTGGNSHSAAISSGIAGQTLIDDGTPSGSALGNVLLGLMDGNGNEIARQLSDSNGDYHFYNLSNDNYKVNVISSPQGYAIVRNTNGTTPPLDTLSGLVLAGAGVNGQSFWFKTASVDGIQGKVYVDFADASTSVSALDSHTHLIGNNNPVTVELYDGLGATGTKLMTTTTSNGAYKFPNLIFGTGVDYSVKIVMNSLPDFAFKLSKDGNTSTAEVIDVANLPSAGVLDNDYVVVGKLKVAGDVWIDADADLAKGTAELVDGVTVTLNYKAPGSSSFTALHSMTTGTAPATAGQYSFTKLPKGTDYEVVVDSDSTVLAGTSLIPATGDNSIADNSDTFTLTALATDSVSHSTAYKYNGAVSGQLVIDVDSNNVATAGLDTLFAGVDLELTATINGTAVTKTVTTDADGKFSLTNLPIANWSLKAAATQTLTDWSQYRLGFVKNSAGTTATGTTAFPLSIALTAADVTFDNIVVGYQGTAKISGYVVIDIDPTDGDHAVLATDTAVDGLTVTLGSNTPGFVTRTTTTDTNGYYEFNTLATHTYNVAIDTTDAKLAGHIASFDPLGTTLSAVNIAVTAANSNLTTQDFGYKSNGSLSGYIYRDVSGTGIRHAERDDKLAGVIVKATQGTTVRYSNTTGADGEYKIDNLATGLWTIELNTLPSTDHSYSYLAEAFGLTATVVANGAEIDISPIAPRAAVKGATLSFGLKANASISGQVVIDVDDTVPVTANVDTADIAIDTLFAGYEANLYVGNTLMATSPVSSGAYSFTSLSDNVDYRVEVLAPSADYLNSFNVASSNTGVTVGTAVDSATTLSQTYTLTTTNTVATDSNFGWKGVGSIAGEVFWDKDDNGTYTAGSDESINAALKLTFTQSGLPTITRTIAAGDTLYAVTGMIPGSWLIKVEDVPSTFKASFDPDDTYNASSLANTAHQATVSVGATALTAKHFGYIKGGAMSGAIKDDAMSTGTYSATAPGLGGADVELLNSTSAPVLDIGGTAITSTSDSDGHFSFRNLDPTQDYKVRVAFGSATTSLLTDMEPSYDSEVGAINLAMPPLTVDVMTEQHTIEALVSTATNNELTADLLHFGYRPAGGDLTIHKVALKEQVVVGDLVPYRITIENNLATPALNIVLRDLIPAGFKYVNGSARLDGVKITDPAGGRPIEFRHLDVGGNTGAGGTPSKRTLTYLLVVGAGVTQGEYVNTAVAVNRKGEEASNISQATVTVTADPLFDNSLIFGKVYVDRNGNGTQDEGEEGLGGVKLVTARGEIITTDQYGRYHLAGVEGGRWERGTNFVLKLDVRSLPAGYKAVGRNPIVTRLSPGLPSKVDFKVSEIK